MQAEIFLWTAAGASATFRDMKITSHLLHAGLLALVTLTPAFADREGWTADFDAAKKQAATEKKDMMLDFTGSDWCPWCVKLDKEVFQQAAFTTGVKDKLVLVEVDFPHDKSKLSDATQAQNEKLREEFKPKGYPTIFLCDAGGKPYAQLGYEPDGPAKYVAHLNSLMQVRAKRDAAFAAAETATDPTKKAKSLVEGLKVMDSELVEACYSDVVARIGDLDKDDSTGYLKEMKEAKAKKEAAAAAQEEARKAAAPAIKALQEFMQAKVMPLMQAKDFDKAYTEVQDYLKANAGVPEDIKIDLTLNVGLPRFIEKGDVEAANKFVDEIIAKYPNHPVAKQGDKIKQQIKAHIEQAKAQPAAPKPE